MSRRTWIALLVGLAAILACGSPAFAHDPPPALTSFTPVGIVAGEWVPAGADTAAHIDVSSKTGCDGTTRRWSRADKVELALSWVQCNDEDFSVLTSNAASARAALAPEWRDQSVLDDHADLVGPLGEGQIARAWHQSGLQLLIVISCSVLPALECAALGGPVARSLAAALPGAPVVAQPQSPVTLIVTALTTSWLLLVGATMLGSRLSQETFTIGCGDPRLFNVERSARRLRWLVRGRRWGRALSCFAAILFTSAVFDAIGHAAVSAAAKFVLGAFFTTGGVLLIVYCRPPVVRLEWLRWRAYRLRRATWRRILSVVVSGALGALALALPVAFLVAFVLAQSPLFDRDLRSIFGGGIIAAVGAGFLVDRAARRLRTRNTWEALQDDTRPHLLYLRNFGDDALKLQVSALTRRGLWQTATGWLSPIRKTRFEEVLSRASSRFGPIIAVDPPGTRLSTLGFAKTTLPFDRWQDQVHEWADGALGVIVAATPAEIRPGLSWELQLIAERLPHGRVALVLGPWTKASIPRNFGVFLAHVRRYPLFAALANAWVTDGVLVLVHVPAYGWGSWIGWGAKRRTAWTYAAAVDEAMGFAKAIWQTPARLTDPFGGRPPSAAVVTCLDRAAAETPAGACIDTRAVLRSLLDNDAEGCFGRLILPGSVCDDQTGPLLDPDSEPTGHWRGKPLSAACAQALRMAARIAEEYGLQPTPVGAVAIGLVADRRNAAARVLGISTEDDQRSIIARAQDDLLGVTLDGLDVGLPTVDRSAEATPNTSVSPRIVRIDDRSPIVAERLESDRIDRVPPFGKRPLSLRYRVWATIGLVAAGWWLFGVGRTEGPDAVVVTLVVATIINSVLLYIAAFKAGSVMYAKKAMATSAAVLLIEAAAAFVLSRW
jgi:hypothetical protein